MTKKRLPYLYSFAFHLILALILYFIHIGLEPVQDEYVTIGFGAIGKKSSSGVLANKPAEETKKKQPEEKKEIVKKIVKKVELPKVKNPDKENDEVVAADRKEEEVVTPEIVEPIVKKEEEAGQGKEEVGDGDGNHGFEIDFGGTGMRKIYSYSLPTYPDGVSKEIDVKLKFSILPDGSVGRIFPLIKADARLELAAINSLRQWRFEPLLGSKQASEQFAIIIFPFRLQ